MTWIQTRTGRRFEFEQIGISKIDPQDVAWSLAHQCRFNGHCRRFYSVAEPTLRMLIAPELLGMDLGGDADQVALAIMVHDAHEAYVSDLPRPIKWLLGDHWGAIERQCELHVRNELDAGSISPKTWDLVRLLDNSMLQLEARELLVWPQQPWDFGSTAGVLRGPLGAPLGDPEETAERWLLEYDRCLIGRDSKGVKS